MMNDTDSMMVRDTLLHAGYRAHCVADELYAWALELRRPSTVYRPTVSRDGNMWCALYGENIQEGVCGFGETPELAMRQFDIEFLNARAAK